MSGNKTVAHVNRNTLGELKVKTDEVHKAADRDRHITVPHDIVREIFKAGCLLNLASENEQPSHGYLPRCQLARIPRD